MITLSIVFDERRDLMSINAESVGATPSEMAAAGVISYYLDDPEAFEALMVATELLLKAEKQDAGPTPGDPIGITMKQNLN